MIQRKQLGLIAAIAIVTGDMLGSSIAPLPADLATVGSITTISWIIAVIGAISVALVFAKLAAKSPQGGGPVSYAGGVAPYIGFQAGIFYFNANWISNLMMAITCIAYLAILFPVLANPIIGGIATIMLIWLVTGVNIIGVKWVGRLSTLGVLLLLCPVVVTSVFGWHHFHHATFTANWNVSHHSNSFAVFSGLLLCIWSFIGVESASVNANLVIHPKKNIPRATMIGIIIAAVVYFLSSTVIVGMESHQVIAQNEAPFCLVCGIILGHWAIPVVAGFIAFSCFSALSSWVMLVAQSGLRAAKDGALPAVFGELNHKGMPVKSMLLTATGMSLIVLLFMYDAKSAMHLFVKIISISSLLTILAYFYSALNLLKYHKHEKYVRLLVTIAVLFCLSAFFGVGYSSLLMIFLLLLLTLVFYVRKDRTALEQNCLYRTE